ELGEADARRGSRPRDLLSRRAMAWYTRVANVFRPHRLSADLSREIDFHIAERTDALIERPASAARWRVSMARPPRRPPRSGHRAEGGVREGKATGDEAGERHAVLPRGAHPC